METMEMPTQMTVNAPTTIGGGSNSGSRFESSKVELYPPGVEEVNKPDVHAQTTPGVEEAEFAYEIKSKSTADKLFDSAKDEGFEEALEHLANGDFDERMQDAGVTEDATEESEIVDAVEGETVIEDAVEFPIDEQIKMLEERVEVLQNDNKELLERAKKAEETNSVNQEMMLALAKALYELAKEEEDKEKKVDFLEIIIKMLTLFMQEVMTDGPIENEKEQNEKSTKTQGKTKKSETLKALINDLESRDRKIIDIRSQRQHRAQPNIEMNAA